MRFSAIFAILMIFFAFPMRAKALLGDDSEYFCGVTINGRCTQHWVSQGKTWTSERLVAGQNWWEASFRLPLLITSYGDTPIRIVGAKYTEHNGNALEHEPPFVFARISNAEDWASLTGRFHLICWPVLENSSRTLLSFTIDKEASTFDIYTKPTTLDRNGQLQADFAPPYDNLRSAIYVKSYTFEVLNAVSKTAVRAQEEAAEGKREEEQAAKQEEARRQAAALARLPLLNNGREQVAIAEDQGCLNDVAKALALEGLQSRKMLAELYQYGCFFTVPSDTPVVVQNRTTKYARVSVAAGLGQGRSGWVMSSWVRSHAQ